MHVHASGVNDRTKAGFGKFPEDIIGLVRIAVMEEPLIRLPDGVMVRRLKDGPAPYSERRLIASTRTRDDSRPLLGHFIFQNLIDCRQFSESSFMVSNIA
jgi:hypothetical protein